MYPIDFLFINAITLQSHPIHDDTMHTKHLPHDSGRIDWETNLFSARESRELMRELEAALPWRQFPIRMFGQMV